MKRYLALAFLPFFGLASVAHASLGIPDVGSTLGSWSQYTNHAWDGGPFDWATGTVGGHSVLNLESFCGQFNGLTGTNYVAGYVTPIKVGSTSISGLTFGGGTGVVAGYPNAGQSAGLVGFYLFALWSEGVFGDPSNTGAGGVSTTINQEVQAALWESIGYSDTTIGTSTGAGQSAIDAAESGAFALAQSKGYNPSLYSVSGATPGLFLNGASVALVELTASSGGGQSQDQVFFETPEPATIVIWGVGIGLAGMASLRRRNSRRWTAESRQAILQVIEGKK